MRIRRCEMAMGVILLFAGTVVPLQLRSDDVNPNLGSILNDNNALPVEPNVVAKVVDAIRKLAPDVKVISKGKHAVRMESLCQEYSVYRGGKGGRDKSLVKEIGPTDHGFMLTFEWWQKAYTGQAGSYSGELREFYWSRHLREFKLPKDRGFLRMDYSPGAMTDPKIHAAILNVLETECGLEKKNGQDSDSKTVRYPIDQLHDELEPRLRTLIQKQHPNATVKRVGQELVVSYRVQDYVLHAVEANGSVAKNSHVEVGPTEDGFLIKIEGARSAVQGQSLQIHGRTSGPFWNRVWNSFAPGWRGDRELIRYGIFRLDISYTSKSHHPLFREIEDLLTDYGKPASKGLYE